MDKRTLDAILTQFDCSNVDYDAKNYISFSALGKANGDVRFNLIFDYADKNATKSREMTVKNPQVAMKVFEALLWGRKVMESETNDFLENMLTDNKEGNGWK